MQSFASQIVHQPRLFVLSGVHPWAASARQELLQLASKCFTEALGLGGCRHAEPWIYHWMLAKVGHNLNRPIKSIMENLVAVSS